MGIVYTFRRVLNLNNLIPKLEKNTGTYKITQVRQSSQALNSSRQLYIRVSLQ